MNEQKSKGVLIKFCDKNIVSLEDILSNVIDGKNYIWAFQWLEGYWKKGKSQFKIPTYLSGYENFFILEWDELTLMSEQNFEMSDCCLFGKRKNGLEFSIYEEDVPRFNSAEYVFQLLDGSEWFIFSKNYDFIKEIYKSFIHTSYIEADFWDVDFLYSSKFYGKFHILKINVTDECLEIDTRKDNDEYIFTFKKVSQFFYGLKTHTGVSDLFEHSIPDLNITPPVEQKLYRFQDMTIVAENYEIKP